MRRSRFCSRRRFSTRINVDITRPLLTSATACHDVPTWDLNRVRTTSMLTVRRLVKWVTEAMSAIQTFFFRVSARCNLACEYCYVFKHNDMSWRDLPRIVSSDTVALFAKRLREYAEHEDLKTILVVLHGGEPLLVGSTVLVQHMDTIRDSMRGTAQVDFSLQTNGTMITSEFAEACHKRGVQISVSIDGPKHVHDRRRHTANGHGSFARVLRGIRCLQTYPDLLCGVIGVIDPRVRADEILRFYSNAGLNDMDLLLPDATYDRPPPYRTEQPDIYVEWLIEAFDAWFDHYQHLSLRTFESILRSHIGLNTSSDTFGLGELTYLTVESDGSYHTSDILKAAYEGASKMGITLYDASIAEAASHRCMADYNRLLMRENLPDICRHCEFCDMCGGGSLPHRFSQLNRFNNPTVYCREMKALFGHAGRRIADEVKAELAIES